MKENLPRKLKALRHPPKQLAAPVKSEKAGVIKIRTHVRTGRCSDVGRCSCR